MSCTSLMALSVSDSKTESPKTVFVSSFSEKLNLRKKKKSPPFFSFWESGLCTVSVLSFYQDGQLNKLLKALTLYL